MRQAGSAPENSLAVGGSLQLIVPDARAGQRLDHYLVEMIPDLSRSHLGNLIRAGFVRVNGAASKASSRLKGGDAVDVTLPPPEPVEITPEKVDFTVLHEDDDLLVIAKPPGIVVHPACGHKSGTIVHGILAHCASLSGISGVERPGIVHRLDKDTSGVMVIAKSDRAHHALVDMFKTRQVKKVYHAIVVGRPKTAEGCINRGIGRHRSNRKKMAVVAHGGRDAVTCWETIEQLPFNMTYLAVKPETGRTHQIRVHMAYLGHPVAGDAQYGSKQSRTTEENLGIGRQCLHAYSLAFNHPVTGEAQEFISPLWPDMQRILQLLRKYPVQ